MSKPRDAEQLVQPWQDEIFAIFQQQNIAHVGFVPDGGHKGLIRLCEQSDTITTTVLTTEEEGIGLSTGLWLGGKRCVLLMQSSGVGNCINMLALPESCRVPLVMLITMRGEWAEYVPWQIPMGRRVEAILTTMGVDVYRSDRSDEVAELVSGALEQAFYSNRSVAVLLGQRLIGRKNWSK